MLQQCGCTNDYGSSHPYECSDNCPALDLCICSHQRKRHRAPLKCIVNFKSRPQSIFGSENREIRIPADVEKSLWESSFPIKGTILVLNISGSNNFEITIEFFNGAPITRTLPSGESFALTAYDLKALKAISPTNSSEISYRLCIQRDDKCSTKYTNKSIQKELIKCDVVSGFNEDDLAIRIPADDIQRTLWETQFPVSGTITLNHVGNINAVVQPIEITIELFNGDTIDNLLDASSGFSITTSNIKSLSAKPPLIENAGVLFNYELCIEED